MAQIKTSGQSATELILLTAIVLIVILPFFIGPSKELTKQRIASVDDAVRAVKHGALTLSDLGYKSATRVVVQIPKGVKYSSINNNTITVIVANREVDINVGVPIYGIFPTNEGRHFIDLYNNGTSILLYECGNGILEDDEHCEPPSPTLPYGINGICLTNSTGGFNCGQPGTPEACKCLCTTDSNCPSGYSCDSGVCTPSSSCGDGIIGRPEECDPASPLTNGGCLDGLCNVTCGCNPPTFPPPVGCGDDFCDPLTEDCLNCPADCGLCTPPPPPMCGDYEINLAWEQCDCDDPSNPDCKMGICLAGSSCVHSGLVNQCTCEGFTLLPCPLSLLGYWKFDENLPGGSATAYYTITYDSSCNNYHGQLNGPSYVIPSYSGYFGNSSLELHGDNVAGSDFVILGITTPLDFPPQGTLEMIFKPNFLSQNLARVMAFASEYYPGPYTPYIPYGDCFRLLQNPNAATWGAEANKIAARFGSAAATYAISNNPINLNVHHVALTWTPTLSKLYIDGQLQSTLGYSALDCYNQVYIGGMAYPIWAPPNTNSFVGIIDEVILFNEPLNATLAQMHYNNFLNNQPYCISPC